MKRRLLTIGAVLAVPAATLALAGTAGGDDAASTQEPPLFALIVRADARSETTLARLHPRTFAPVGTRLRLGSQLMIGGRSPDGRLLALFDRRARPLRIVDLEGMRIRRDVALGLGETWRLTAVAWVTADRLVVLAQRMRGSYDQIVDARQVLLVDPIAGRVLDRSPFGDASAALGSASGGDRLVVLLGRADRRGGSVRVAAVDGAGTARFATVELGSSRSRRVASLVVEPSGRRAFVVAAGAPVAEIDLATMQVSLHAVQPPRALRVRGEFAVRHGVWVDDRTLALAGEDVTRVRGVETTRAAGAVLVDTKTWRARVIDAGATAVAARAGTVLAYGGALQLVRGRQRLVGVGLTAYDRDGARRWSRYPGRRVAVTPFRRFVQVMALPTPLRALRAAPAAIVLDLATGRQLGRLARRGEYVSIVPDPPTARASRSRSVQARVQAPDSYTIGNQGRPITLRRPQRLFHERRAQAFLLGTANGRAFYRIRPVGVNLTCFAIGSAQRLGEIGALSCAHRLGTRPLVEFNMGGGSRGEAMRLLRAEGVAADEVATVAAVDAAGNTLASVTPSANVYSFPQPLPAGVARTIGLDAGGAPLPPRRGTVQDFPEFLFGPRAGIVSPAELRDPIRRGENRGVVVTLGRNGVALFDATRADARVRRLSGGRRVGFSCFRLRQAHDADGVGVSAALKPRVAIRIRGLRMPLSGCEISGSWGRRWRDGRGTRALVEAAFDARARRYFDDRAAARDLALFVRSREVQRIRRQTGETLRRLLRQRYGNRIVELPSASASPPPGEVGYWIGGGRTLFVERSTTGFRFFVELVDGRITSHNLRRLAFVF